MKKIICFSITFIFISSFIFGWDGYDYNSGEYVEIEKGNLVRKDKDIEIYHWGDGSYHDEEVQGIHNKELETYDYETGDYNYYEMD